MNEQEIKICESIIELFNKVHFTKVKPGQMVEYSRQLQAFAYVIKSYKEKLDSKEEVTEAKPKIQMTKGKKDAKS